MIEEIAYGVICFVLFGILMFAFVDASDKEADMRREQMQKRIAQMEFIRGSK